MPKVGEQIAKGEKRLTPPQQKFLDNYIHKDMTQTAAARAAVAKARAVAPEIRVKPAAPTIGEHAKTPATATLIPVSRDARAVQMYAKAAAMIG